MKPVLVLAPYVPHPLTHGGSIRTRLLLQAIAADHRVHLAVPVADSTDRANLQALAATLPLQTHAVPVAKTTKSGLLRKLGIWARGRSELLERRWRPDGAATVATVAASVRPAAIVADSSFVFPVLPESTAPLLLHLHNLEGGVFARGGETRRRWRERFTRHCEARAITATERRVLARAAATITVSDLDRDTALALAPGARVVAVPVSVDLARVPLLPPPSTAAPVRILFVGTMDYPPNFEAVAELVHEHLPVLRAAFPGLVARLVGRDEEHRLDAFANVPGVEVVGTAPEVRPHYEASHAVYLPIRTGGGTRGKIIEAWGFGRPVLATAIGAEALAGEEGRHWRRFETPAQGVDALRAVLADGAGAMVAAARALVEERYTHAVAFAALRDVVRSVTGV